jgi:FtsP/CotA-like multicopper oxidase with cupredoxin domain
MIPGTPSDSQGMESFMDTPVVNGTAYPYLEVDPKAYRFRILNAANDRFWNLQLYEADPAVTSIDGRTNTEVRMVPATAASNLPADWPADGREGGVPDPLLSGPEMIQIGSEGGFLPEPVVLPNRPVSWNLDATTFNAGLVNGGTLMLGSAERADVIVDFSAWAGKTIILYNDAPAPWPAWTPQFDYYTGAPDLTDTGGSPGTIPGFGPNTRTVMQIRVRNIAPATPFDMTALNDEFVPPGGGDGVFVRGQDPIIVGQSAYDAVYNTTFPASGQYWGISNIQNNTLSFQTVTGSLIDDFPMEPKAIQDEQGEAFDVEYGRMSGFLGLENPTTVAGAQNFKLYPYPSPPTEIIATTVPGAPIGGLGDGTQIWKITHNGVDTHPIHFHLYDVQLINRVAWDGAITLPDPNERGWKDTIRISPLEDTIVALRPIVPTFPFDIPNSVRLISPANAEGEILRGPPGGFQDPLGNPIVVTNHYVNFGWEYVWHCHILNHEEMDMMHGVGVTVPPSAAPSDLSYLAAGDNVTLSWTDNSVNESGFIIQKRQGDTGVWMDKETVPAVPGTGNTVEYTDVGYSTDNVTATYYYQILATNVVGDVDTPNFPTITMNSDPSNIVVVPGVGVAMMPDAADIVLASLPRGYYVRMIR